MGSEILYRNVTPLAEETLADTPITVISGARQVGKSTLMNQLTRTYETKLVNLDNATERSAAEADPDGFVSQFPQGTLAIDEIQRVPELLTALKASVDQDRRPGRFIVTGSANLLSLRGAQESLAGRAETITLEGFSQDELAGHTADFAQYIWSLPSFGATQLGTHFTRRDYLRIMTTPTFPEAHKRTDRSRERWLSNYTDRLLAKDSTDITGIQYPERLETLLSVIAARNGSEFVAARVGRDMNVPERSVPAYLRALQSVFLVRIIPGWSDNIAKRAVSTPKVTIADTGLAAHLAGVDMDGLEQSVSSTLIGGLLEGFVIGEIQRQQQWSTTSTRMFHYRDDHSREVDLILEDRQRNIAGIEVKATSNPRRQDFKGLIYLRDHLNERFTAGVVLHTGEQVLPFGDRLWALPLSTLWNHLGFQPQK